MCRANITFTKFIRQDEKDLNKETSCLVLGRIKIMKIYILPKLIYTFLKLIPIKTQIWLFLHPNKIVLKFPWKSIFGKNNIMGEENPDIKI